MLEIGTGSGYQAAILVAMQLDVYTIEIVPDLKTRSTRWLTELGYMHTGRLHTLLGDGYMGWPSAAPFDGIVVTCSPVRRPYPLSSHPPTMLAQDLVRCRGDSSPGILCAQDHVPQPLKEQLRIGGRLVIPVGPDGGFQSVHVVTRDSENSWTDTFQFVSACQIGLLLNIHGSFAFCQCLDDFG